MEKRDRIQKLIEIMERIDNSFGIGLEEITLETNVDDYISRFIETFTVIYDMNDELFMLNENLGSSYMEKLNEI